MPRQQAKRISGIISSNCTTIYGMGSFITPHLIDEKLSLSEAYILRGGAGIQTQAVWFQNPCS